MLYNLERSYDTVYATVSMPPPYTAAVASQLSGPESEALIAEMNIPREGSPF